MHDTFEQVIKHLERVMAADCPLKYVGKILRNKCLDRLRSPGTKPLEFLDDMPPDCEPLDPGVAPHFLSQSREILSCLPNREHQEVFILCYVEEMGQEEIAREIGCCRGTVVNRLKEIQACIAPLLREEQS